MNRKWSLLGVGTFYTREEALTLLSNMSDFEDESTSESEIEGDSSDSSEYAPEQYQVRTNSNIQTLCLKKQLFRMPQSMLYWLHPQKYLKPKKYPKWAKKLHQNQLCSIG